VTLARASACAAPAAFAVLAAVLATLGAVPTAEAGWATAAVALAFLPTGWLAPAGWRRRAAELSLLAPALAVTLLADPTMRRMALPPLLALAAWAAAAAALTRADRHGSALIPVGLALAVRAAGGLGLAGTEPTAVLLALVAPALAAWGSSRALGTSTGVALLVGALPLERSPVAAAGLAAAGVLLARLPRPPVGFQRVQRGFAPALPAAALVVTALAPWGGLAPARLLPGAGWPALAAGVAAAAAGSPCRRRRRRRVAGGDARPRAAATLAARPPGPQGRSQRRRPTCRPPKAVPTSSTSRSPTEPPSAPTSRSPARERSRCAPASRPPSGPTSARMSWTWSRTRCRRGRCGDPPASAAARCGG
jgi:hypothetical protein